MTDWRHDFIAVDWGTTNRRAYAVSKGGIVGDGLEDDLGVTSVKPGAFAEAVAAIRARLGDAPMLLAGMVGSSRGWVETAYVAAPAGLGALAAALHHVEPGIAIVPGVCVTGARHDIMRGEEVQALGAVAAGLIPAEACICHPGTHSKWIEMRAGEIAGFQTAMTGEIFALLKHHSILAPQLTAQAAPGPAFLSGVDTALEGRPLLDALFEVRSRIVLGALAGPDAASYTSGLLIGADVLSHVKPGDRISLLGRPELCALYAAALDRAGCSSETTDGAEAFVAGMSAIGDLL
jgi:2-dehydro-3-deoxygalactonokinase